MNTSCACSQPQPNIVKISLTMQLPHEQSEILLQKNNNHYLILLLLVTKSLSLSLSCVNYSLIQLFLIFFIGWFTIIQKHDTQINMLKVDEAMKSDLHLLTENVRNRCEMGCLGKGQKGLGNIAHQWITLCQLKLSNKNLLSF